MLHWVKHETKIPANPNHIHMLKRSLPPLLQLHPPSFLSSNTNDAGREMGRDNPSPKSCCKNSECGFFSPGGGYLGKAMGSRSDAHPLVLCEDTPHPTKAPISPCPRHLCSPRGLPGEPRWKGRLQNHEGANNRSLCPWLSCHCSEPPPRAPCKRGGWETQPASPLAPYGSHQPAPRMAQQRAQGQGTRTAERDISALRRTLQEPGAKGGTGKGS